MEFLKSLKWNSIIGSILMILLGVVLIFFPSLSLNVISNMIGISAIVGGIFSIIRYFMIDLKESFYRNDFLNGVIMLVIGALVVFKPSFFISLIPLMLGIVILFSGISKLQDGISAKRLGYQNSTSYILLGVINIIFGLVILFNPFSAANVMFMIIGVGLIYSGVSDLYVTIFLTKRFKDFYKNL